MSKEPVPWQAFFNERPIDQRHIDRMVNDKPKFEATITGRLTDLLNPANLYGPGEWRPIGKQRASKLRKRGKLVEKYLPDAWRWWRTPDPHKVTAAEMFGIPYAQVQPHQRKRAKIASFARMYSPERWSHEPESRKPATPPTSAPRA